MNSRRRFRTLIRQGWHVAEIPRANLYKFGNEEWGNNRHYNEIQKWCRNTFSDGTWSSRLFVHSGTDKVGVKQFVFKNQRDLTMFILKWK